MTIDRRDFLKAAGVLGAGALLPLGRLAPAAAASFGSGVGAATPALVRVKIAGAAQKLQLLGSFDETHNHSDDTIELLLWPGDRERLDRLGFDYTVVSEDLASEDAAAGTRAPSLVQLSGHERDDYRRLDDYNTEMAALADKHPKLIKRFEMPRPSLEGRAIFGLEVGDDVRKTDTRPIFYIDGLHHAREWPAAEYTLLFAYHLAENFGKDARITSLLRRARVICVPIVNVDGFDYSRESVLSAAQPLRDATSAMASGNGFEGYWRKNRRSLTGVTAPVAQRNPDSFGVDPNRNYAYLWGDTQGGSSGTQVNQTYRGEAPFSEPETQNVRDIVLGRTVTGIITNHTYQNSVLRAGGGEAPDDQLLNAIAQRMADATGYDNRGSVGYPTTGTTDDWAYAAAGILGFTFEHGKQGFHPRYDIGVGQDHKKVMEAFTIMLEESADERNHAVISGRVASGDAKVVLKKSIATPLSPGNPVGKESVREKISIPVQVDGGGRFEIHAGPSTRPWAKGRESYTLVVTSGGRTESRAVQVARGQRAELGTIRI